MYVRPKRLSCGGVNVFALVEGCSIRLFRAGLRWSAGPDQLTERMVGSVTQPTTVERLNEQFAGSVLVVQRSEQVWQSIISWILMPGVTCICIVC